MGSFLAPKFTFSNIIGRGLIESKNINLVLLERQGSWLSNDTTLIFFRSMGHAQIFFGESDFLGQKETQQNLGNGGGL